MAEEVERQAMGYGPKSEGTSDVRTQSTKDSTVGILNQVTNEAAQLLQHKDASGVDTSKVA
eukprot:scaffold10249_cov59-Cyclotella_meneghiniana.AAC.7